MAREFLDEVRLTAVPSTAGNYLTLSSNGTISQRTQSQVKSALGVTALEGRSIIAGTGLTGGGTLTSDVNMSVVYGTTTGTSAEGNTVVRVSGAQTVAGVKTFSSIPVLPATSPTTATQAATKGYVDAQVSSVNTGVITLTGGSGVTVTGTSTATVSVDTTVVRTTGNQTLGGTKTFTTIPALPASNPTTDNQAARKAYVDAQVAAVNTGVMSVAAGTGTTVGGTASARTVNVIYGTAANTAAQGNDSRITSAVPNTRTLTGGDGITTTIGNLTADRTISVDNTVVRTSGNQNISGTKWFTGGTNDYIGKLAVGHTGGWARRLLSIHYGETADTSEEFMSFAGYGSGTELRYVYMGTDWSGAPFRVSPSGVGIGLSGTTHPSQALDVDGTARFRDAVNIEGLLTTTQIPVLPSTNPTSANQAARKGYVDAQVSSVNTGVMSVTSGAGISVTGTSTPTIAVDSTVIRTTGNQTLGGTKTFSSIPVLPSSNPTTDNQAARKAYVDAQVSGVNTGVMSVAAGTGTTVGGTASARTVNVTYGTAANTAAQGNDSRITGAVPGTRTLTAGTGIATIGDLSTNRTVALDSASIASLALADTSVQVTGAQTVAGVKTFSSTPLLPAAAPTTANQATNKAYVDAQVSGVNTGVMSVGAGTGTTVGGTSSARTVNVTYGTAANTAAQGNDSRIVNAASTSYVDARSLPAGGTVGQIPTKASSTNYDVEWVDPSGGGALLDGDGINITDDTISVDNTVVRTTGVQSVAGEKTFTEAIRVDNRTEFGGPIVEKVYAVGTGAVIPVNEASVFTATVNAHKGYSFASLPPGGDAKSFVLILTITNSGRNITWASNIKWPDGRAPGLNVNLNSINVITFITYDNGTTWLGFFGGNRFS